MLTKKQPTPSHVLVDLLILGLIYAYLCHLIPFEQVFTATTITGGDTASHYKTADYLQNTLLPQQQVIGWYPGNYGGFPFFTMYFPLLYLIAVAIAEFLPLQVTFKLITLSGPFLLPLSVYLMGLLMRLRFPLPSAMASGSLLFLMIDSNSMWGGNLYSTLAGEFSYAFSFALTFIFLGGLFRLSQDLNKGKTAEPWLVFLLIMLLACIGLSHGFTLIICTLASSWMLRSSAYIVRQLRYLLLIFGLAGLLMSGWLMQLLISAPYTTPFHILWVFTGFTEIMPVMIWPALLLFLLLSLGALLPSRWQFLQIQTDIKHVLSFVWFLLLLILFAFFSSEFLRLPDIRFIPFAQILIIIFGFVFPVLLFSQTKIRHLVPVIQIFMLLLWLGYYPSSVSNWAHWNFQGVEKTPGWKHYSAINTQLKGTFQDPRVVYEHSSQHQQMGTVRAFESLPFFSGRATLEGLYFQSSLLSPFVFYLQSLYSAQSSCPFPEYPCSRLDLARAKDYFNLMHVNQLIAVSEPVRQALRQQPALYQLQSQITGSDYEIWSVRAPSPGYIEVLESTPEYVPAAGFRARFYHWFRNYSAEKPILYTVPETFAAFYQFPPSQAKHRDAATFKQNCSVKEVINTQDIQFTTSCPGQPHLIKVSYHPGWQVEGAQGIYLASPALMLIWPEQEHVILRFNHQGPREFGSYLTLLGMLGCAFYLLFIRLRKKTISHPQLLAPNTETNSTNLHKTVHRFLVLCFCLILLTVFVKTLTPGLLRSLQQGQDWYNLATQSNINSAQRQIYLKKAEASFNRLAKLYVDAPLADRIWYHQAMILYLQGQYEAAIPIFMQVTKVKDSPYLADASYHLGMSASHLQQWGLAQHQFSYVAYELKDPYWTSFAINELKKIQDKHQKKAK